MDVTLFVTLLTIFSTVTSLCTEGCKKLLDKTKISYSSNILVCILACIIGIGGTAAYYGICAIPFNTVNVIFMIVMGFATALGAMIGYDKVLQALQQIKNLNFNKDNVILK